MRIFLHIKHGAVQDSRISLSPDPATASRQACEAQELLQGRKLHELGSSEWNDVLWEIGLEDEESNDEAVRAAGEFLTGQLGLAA